VNTIFIAVGGFMKEGILRDELPLMFFDEKTHHHEIGAKGNFRAWGMRCFCLIANDLL